MKYLYLLALLFALPTGCNQVAGISDYTFDDDAFEDDDDDESDDNDETDDDDEVPDTEEESEEPPVDTSVATITFCHDLSREGEQITINLDVYNDNFDEKHSTVTKCCTPCFEVPAGENLNLILEDPAFPNLSFYETTFTFEGGIDFMLKGIPGDNGQLSLGVDNLTERREVCEEYLPIQYTRCGS